MNEVVNPSSFSHYIHEIFVAKNLIGSSVEYAVAFEGTISCCDTRKSESFWVFLNKNNEVCLSRRFFTGVGQRHSKMG